MYYGIVQIVNTSDTDFRPSVPINTLYLHRLFHTLQSLDYSLFDHAVFAMKTVFVDCTI